MTALNGAISFTVMMHRAELIDPGPDTYYGYGIPDLSGLVQKDPTAIGLSAPDNTLQMGARMTLTAQVTPADASQAVTWVTSNASILTVDANGTVYGVAPGTATVTAFTANSLTASKEITVLYVGLSSSAVALGRDQTVQLTATGNAGAISWTSANSSIATISATGLVKGKKVGTTWVTATFDGKAYACTVTVAKPAISSSKVSITASQTTWLKIAYSSKSVRWSSSRSSVASVSSGGKITARKAGTATITATVDGYRLKCTVTVKANAHSYSVSKDTDDYPYGAVVTMGKLYYSGSTIYMDAYVINNYYSMKLKKLSNVDIEVYDEATGTVIARKNFSTITVNLSAGKIKKVTLKFSGSATKMKTYDLRVNTQSYNVSGSTLTK